MEGLGRWVRWAVVFALMLGVCCSLPCVAFGLPEGRAYEMVSPLYKGGYGVLNITAVSPDGNSVAFKSLGAFAGAPASQGLTNEYIARRGATEWSTAPLMVPATLAPLSRTDDFSASLESSLDYVTLGPSEASAGFEGIEHEFLVHSSSLPDFATNFEVVGQAFTALDKEPFDSRYLGASSTFSTIAFELLGGQSLTGGEDALVAEARGTRSYLYDLEENGEGISSVDLVGLNDNREVIDPYCPVELGSESDKDSQFNAVSANGGEIFFTTNANKALMTECTGSPHEAENPPIVYARVDGQKTLDISTPLTADCDPSAPCGSSAQRPASFEGASETGSCAFFTTSQPLVTGDTDGSNDLYMATVGGPGYYEGAPCNEPVQGNAEVTSMVQVSHDPNAGEAAEVQGVVAVAPNGSHIYFVAKGVLTNAPSPAAQGYGVHGEQVSTGAVAQPGADNLYVYDTETKTITFVVELCAGYELSGVSKDVFCPSNLSDRELWLGAAPEAQTAEDGEFLVFSTYARLNGDDMNAAKDVYRYEAATGGLVRVSVGEDGYDANGNDGASDATIGPTELIESAKVFAKSSMRNRAISENGTRIVFTTARPLSERAINHLANVYEWHMEPGSTEGIVSLVSTGTSTEPVSDVVISPEGNDIFFETSQGLLPQDKDESPDVYDARLGGGFPLLPVSPQECQGEACQGALSVPAPLLVPGSVSQAPGDNLPPPAKPTVSVKKVKAKKKVKKVKAKKKVKKVKAKKAKTKRVRKVNARELSRGSGR